MVELWGWLWDSGLGSEWGNLLVLKIITINNNNNENIIKTEFESKALALKCKV